MEKTNGLLYEKVVRWLLEHIREYRIPLISSWIVGLLAHMFMFTNKIVNHDDVLYLFSKGETLVSGRWLLALTGYIFPNCSMPWIYGVLSLAITAATVCLIVKIFDIRSKYLQALLAGLIVSFPAQTSIFCFMFTSAPYALAFLGSVLSVYILIRGSLKSLLAGSAVLALTLGIYQGYIAVASSLYIILMIQALLKGEPAGKVFKDGLRYAAALLAALGLYYAVTLVICRLSGTELLSYGYSEDNILFRVLLAYNGFLRSIISGYFGFVNSGISMTAHLACLIAMAVLLVHYFSKRRTKKTKEALLLFVCAALFPLSINCLYLIAQTGVINSWTLYSFICVYILAAVIVELLAEKNWLNDVVLISFTLVIISNVFFANKVYLKMYLGNESMFAYYSAMAADIRQSPEYKDGMTLAILGEETDLVEYMDEIDTGYFTGPADNTINMYTRDCFLKYYIGLNVPTLPYLDTYKIRGDIESTDEFKSMPEYPAEGSIAEIDGYLVVKLG